MRLGDKLSTFVLALSTSKLFNIEGEYTEITHPSGMYTQEQGNDENIIIINWQVLIMASRGASNSKPRKPTIIGRARA